MRTAGTEVRHPRCGVGSVVYFRRLVNVFQSALNVIRRAPLFDQDTAQFLRDHHGIKGRLRLEQELAPIVFPTINAAPVAAVENRLFDLNLDQFALFLDHDDQVQTFGPLGKSAHVERPDLPDLIGRQAKACGLIRVDPQQRERMRQIQPILARRDKADFRPRTAPDTVVHLVGVGKRLGRVAFIIDHPRLLGDGRVDQADVQSALWHGEFRRHKGHPVWTAIDDRRGLNRVFHGFQTRPAPREPRQGVTVKAIVQNFLNPCGAEDRHIGVDQGPVRLVQRG